MMQTMATKSFKLFRVMILSLLMIGVMLTGLLGSLVHAAPGQRPLYANCVVNTTNDSGAGSLRACILQLSPGDTITFNPTTFPLANAQTIFVSTALPTIITNNVTIDASNAGVILSGATLPVLADGLVIDGASGVTIRGLAIRSFPQNGIRLQNGASNNTIGGTNGVSVNACTGACNVIHNNLGGGIIVAGTGTSNNTVINNYIGILSNGTTTSFNDEYGLRVEGANNVITGNLISGNLGPGVNLVGIGATGNTVSNNYVGTDRPGSIAKGNRIGLLIEDGAQSNSITNNLFSGNTFEGIQVVGTNTISNTIMNNQIGTNIDGTAAIRNRDGILLDGGAQSTLVMDNLISGQTNNGLVIKGNGTMSNTIVSNEIGTNQAGTASVENIVAGVFVDQEAKANTISDNLISGNTLCGVAIEGTENVVSNNKIGTNMSGTVSVANGFGIELAGGAQSNMIRDNLISGNALPGVFINGSDTMSNSIMVNTIGTDPTETKDLGNRFGVFVSNGAHNNMIDDNMVGFNDKSGIAVYGETTIENTLQQNRVFSNTDKGIALVNGGNQGLRPPGIARVRPNAVEGSAPPGSIVEIYSDNGQEGELFHGTTTADAFGQFSFTLPSGIFTRTNISVVATDQKGNTSEFSGLGAAAFVDNGQNLADNNSRDIGLADLNARLNEGRLDADGYIDALIVNDQEIEIWLNNGNGNYTLSASYPNTNGQAVAVGDLNGDNLPDAFIANNGGNRIWLNDGEAIGHFSGQSLGSNNSQGVALSDLDEDNDLDAIVVNKGSQPNQIWENNGQGNFSVKATLGTADGQAVVIGDLDGNESPDIVIGTGSGQPIEVWLSQGEFNFTRHDTVGNANTQALALADMDLDGDLDIVAGNDGNNEVWRNDGTGKFALDFTLPSPSDSQGIAASDLNSDGYPDIFVTNGGNQANEVWINNRDQTFSYDQTLPGGDSQAVALGDLDHDNDLDTFVVNAEGRVNEVFLNQDIGYSPSIGAEGGTFIAQFFQDGKLLNTKLEIPPNVLTEDTRFRHVPSVLPPFPISPTLRFANRSFSLEATQGKGPEPNPFAGGPVKIFVDFPPDTWNQDQLNLYFWNGNQWEDAACNSDVERNEIDHYIKIEICHLTNFTLFGPRQGANLPLIFKDYPPTILNIINHTGGPLTYTIFDQSGGNIIIECELNDGETKECGRFKPGTYYFKAFASACTNNQTIEGWKTYAPGEVTLTPFVCA